MQRLKEKPNPLFPEGPDWQWDGNLMQWHCTTKDGFKAIIWADWLNPPPPEDKQKKLSKSDGEREVRWDGICLDVPGGPEPSLKQGPILAWLRRGIQATRLKRALTPGQVAALGSLAALGERLSKSSSWDVLLATRLGKDPNTGTSRVEERMVLNTGNLKALQGLAIGEQPYKA